MNKKKKSNDTYSLRVVSSLPDTILRLSGENLQQRTAALCPYIIAVCASVVLSYNRIVLSSPAVNINLSSADHAQPS